MLKVKKKTEIGVCREGAQKDYSIHWNSSVEEKKKKIAMENMTRHCHLWKDLEM